MGAMRCARCGKSFPITLPPYMRASVTKDGIWYPKLHNICTCDREHYEFMVIGLCRKRNKRNGFPPDAWLDVVKEDPKWRKLLIGWGYLKEEKDG